MLDDVNTRPNVAGEFWDDLDLNTQLDSSQDILLSAIADNGIYYLLQGLMKKADVPLTQNVTVSSIPTDYFLSMGATIDNQPARLHKGGVGVIYESHAHYGCSIEGNNVVFIGGSGKTGSLWYLKKPTSFSILPSVERAEFDNAVYIAIMYHAASTLAIKDDSSNTRYEKYYKDAMAALLTEPASMMPQFDDSLIP